MEFVVPIVVQRGEGVKCFGFYADAGQEAHPAYCGWLPERGWRNLKSVKKQENIAGMRKEQGVWVFDSGTRMRALTVERILRIGRLERERRIMGGRMRDVLNGRIPPQKS